MELDEQPNIFKVRSQYLVAENLGVEEETRESLALATFLWC